jgi:hypothetical protein
MALTVFALLISALSYAQNCTGCGCPTNEADLANGGIFCGTCNVNVGNSISITGAVTWCSGTLSINGANGDVSLYDTLRVLSGTVRALDGNNGSLDIYSGGVLVVESGATFQAHDEIRVRNGGVALIDGTCNSQAQDFIIDAGGSVTVNSGGSISAGNGDGDDIFVNGTLIMNGGTATADAMNVGSGGSVETYNATVTINNEDITVASGGSWIDTASTISADNFNIDGTFMSTGTVTAGTDFIVDGGTAVFGPGGFLSTGDDLKVYGGGSFTLEFGAGAAITDNVVNNTSGGGGGTSSQGTILICDTMTVGGDFTVFNTTPNSSACGCGSGVLIVQGSFSDNESPPCDFAACAGGGAICTSATLPVTWLDFEGRLVETDKVELIWSTASEINNEGFQIERSFKNLNFEKIGFIEGHGNSREIRTYAFTDRGLMPGDYYYRLKQVDYNGDYDYSKVIAVRSELPKEIRIYPNPSQALFSVVLPKDVIVGTYRLVDVSNNEVQLNTTRVNGGMILDASELKPGVYFLLLYHDAVVTTHKLVKY